MKKLRWILVGVGVLLLLLVGLFIFRDALLRAFLESRVERETGVEASVGSAHLDFSAGSVRVTELKLQNPPGFGDGVMLHIPEVFLRIDGEVSGKNALRFHQAWVNVAEFNIVRSADGRTNLFELNKRLRKKKKKEKPEESTDEFRGIGELKVTLGTVRYTDLQNPSRSQEFKIGIKDEVVTSIKNSDDLEKWGTALLIRIAIQQALQKSKDKQGGLFDLLRKPPR